MRVHQLTLLHTPTPPVLCRVGAVLCWCVVCVLCCVGVVLVLCCVGTVLCWYCVVLVHPTCAVLCWCCVVLVCCVCCVCVVLCWYCVVLVHPTCTVLCWCKAERRAPSHRIGGQGGGSHPCRRCVHRECWTRTGAPRGSGSTGFSCWSSQTLCR